jgi:hypothetical protein
MIRLALIALLLLVATPAIAATQRVWITEFASSRVEAQSTAAQLSGLVKTQPPLDALLGPKTSLPFDKSTRYIRIICEMQCAINTKTTATTNDILLPALHPEYFIVAPGSTINVIAAP